MEALPGGGGGSHVALLNFKTSGVGVYKCPALPSLSQFGLGRLPLVAISFHALSPLFGPCCLSEYTLAGLLSADDTHIVYFVEPTQALD